MGYPPFAGRGKSDLTPYIKINLEGEFFTRKKFFVKIRRF